MPYYDHMGGWGAGFMLLGLIVFWVPLFTGGYLLYRAWRSAEDRRHPRPTPAQLLAERFARGEIDHDEYERRLDTLRTH